MRKQVIAILLLSLNTFTSADAHNAIPASLMFADNPIDSLCFFNMEKSSTINLDQCGAAQEKYTISGHSHELHNKGYIGYDWKIPNSAEQGYSYYKFFNADTDKYWIYTMNETSGSGKFTSIQLVQRAKPTTLTTDYIRAGDRCNRGIENVSEKDQTLTYSINLTAYDFVSLADNPLTKVKPYNDLAACATCCVGKATYTQDIHSKPKLDSVSIGYFKHYADIPTQGKYQHCFNKLFLAYARSDASKIDQKAINDFANQFETACVH